MSAESSSPSLWWWWAGVGSLSSFFMGYLIRYGLLVSLFLSLCSYMGWTRRFLWVLAEDALSDAFRTTVTIGSLDLSFLRGTVLITNVIIHTPQQQQQQGNNNKKEWKWESPLIVRIGRLRCRLFLWGYVMEIIKQWCSMVDCLLFRREGQDENIYIMKVDLYSMEISDCQFFVERQQNVFNFHLLDPNNNTVPSVPTTTIVPDTTSDTTIVHSHQQPQEEDGAPSSSPIPFEETLSTATDSTTHTTATTTTTVTTTTMDEEDLQEQQQARELMQQMFSALQTSLKRRNGWKDAWRVPKQTLTSKLREWQQAPRKADAMQHGVRVLQQAVATTKTNLQRLEASNTTSVTTASTIANATTALHHQQQQHQHQQQQQQQKASASSVPQQQPPQQLPPPFVLRVGRIQLKEMRVFTRDYLVTKRWNKPIVIGQVVLRAAELCPPLSLLDDEGLPALYQPIDKIMEVIMRRVLAEMAKSQSGRLLHSAVGEVLGFMTEE